MEMDLEKYLIWVLVPVTISNNTSIDYYYDYSQSKAEYETAFNNLKIDWHWQPVDLYNFTAIIDKIAVENQNRPQIVLNLCDGTETDGTPGISVIHYLDTKKIIYTGADSFFYHVTTSKFPMKKAFDQHSVPTAKWEQINSITDVSQNLFDKLYAPIILKPAVSGGSMGIGIKNVVSDLASCASMVKHLWNGYHGWEIGKDGIIAESFIEGPEFTVFIVGDYGNRKNACIYTPVERVFHQSLPETEKFLSYERLWEVYESENAMPNNDFFYQYALPDQALIIHLENIAWSAYEACKGTGYGRVDIRMNKHNGQLLVLEVNAQCGISEDEDYTSIGAILKASKSSFSLLLKQLLVNSIKRQKQPK
jgi:D-alanine-D-alanine ligase